MNEIFSAYNDDDFDVDGGGGGSNQHQYNHPYANQYANVSPFPAPYIPPIPLRVPTAKSISSTKRSRPSTTKSKTIIPQQWITELKSNIIHKPELASLRRQIRSYISSLPDPKRMFGGLPLSTQYGLISNVLISGTSNTRVRDLFNDKNQGSEYLAVHNEIKERVQYLLLNDFESLIQDTRTATPFSYLANTTSLSSKQQFYTILIARILDILEYESADAFRLFRMELRRLKGVVLDETVDPSGRFRLSLWRGCLKDVALENAFKSYTQSSQYHQQQSIHTQQIQTALHKWFQSPTTPTIHEKLIRSPILMKTFDHVLLFFMNNDVTELKDFIRKNHSVTLQQHHLGTSESRFIHVCIPFLLVLRTDLQIPTSDTALFEQKAVENAAMVVCMVWRFWNALHPLWRRENNSLQETIAMDIDRLLRQRDRTLYEHLSSTIRLSDPSTSTSPTKKLTLHDTYRRLFQNLFVDITNAEVLLYCFDQFMFGGFEIVAIEESHGEVAKSLDDLRTQNDTRQRYPSHTTPRINTWITWITVSLLSSIRTELLNTSHVDDVEKVLRGGLGSVSVETFAKFCRRMWGWEEGLSLPGNTNTNTNTNANTNTETEDISAKIASILKGEYTVPEVDLGGNEVYGKPIGVSYMDLREQMFSGEYFLSGKNQVQNEQMQQLEQQQFQQQQLQQQQQQQQQQFQPDPESLRLTSLLDQQRAELAALQNALQMEKEKSEALVAKQARMEELLSKAETGVRRKSGFDFDDWMKKKDNSDEKKEDKPVPQPRDTRKQSIAIIEPDIPRNSVVGRKSMAGNNRVGTAARRKSVLEDDDDEDDDDDDDEDEKAGGNVLNKSMRKMSVKDAQEMNRMLKRRSKFGFGWNQEQ